jgi:hypothetical protein
MKKIFYLLVALLLIGGALWASSRQESSTKPQDQELEDFVPSERVPAGSSISFPVDI